MVHDPDSDPLVEWYHYDESARRASLKTIHRSYERFRDRLDRIEQIWTAPKINASQSQWVGYDLADYPYPLPQEGVEEVQELVRLVAGKGAAGSGVVQDVLMDLVGRTANPWSASFWAEMMEYTRPRDKYTPRRRRFAASGLARLAVVRECRPALEALLLLMGSGRPEVRTEAVKALTRAYWLWDRTPSALLVDAVFSVAVEAPEFAPRLSARLGLADCGQEIPADDPFQLYSFEVKLKRDPRFTCRIEMGSENTLDELTGLILQAFRWEDGDHMYAFFLSGKAWDDDTGFISPHSEQEDDRLASDWAIGDLGFVQNCSFLLLFDFGDCHEFDVKVRGISPLPEGFEPRVAAGRGRRPKQN